MKIGALVVGILGALAALLYGVFGFGLASLADAGREGSGTLVKILSVGVPLAALVGAGVVMSRPMLGAVLMGGSALALLLVLGFNFFSFIPVVLLGIGAMLGYLALQA